MWRILHSSWRPWLLNGMRRSSRILAACTDFSASERAMMALRQSRFVSSNRGFGPGCRKAKSWRSFYLTEETYFMNALALTFSMSSLSGQWKWTSYHSFILRSILRKARLSSNCDPWPPVLVKEEYVSPRGPNLLAKPRHFRKCNESARLYLSSLSRTMLRFFKEGSNARSIFNKLDSDMGPCS